jgi:hypothetical protein
MEHPFDPSSITAEACNSGHIAVSRGLGDHTLSRVVRDAPSSA